MRTLQIAVLLLATGGATDAATAPGMAACPERRAHDDGRTYGVRAHDYCEVRWQGLLAARRTGGQTHDESVDGCLRQCVTARHAEAGAPLEWIVGGVLAASLAYGVAAEGDGGRHSATPPASP